MDLAIRGRLRDASVAVLPAGWQALSASVGSVLAHFQRGWAKVLTMAHASSWTLRKNLAFAGYLEIPPVDLGLQIKQPPGSRADYLFTVDVKSDDLVVIIKHYGSNREGLPRLHGVQPL